MKIRILLLLLISITFSCMTYDSYDKENRVNINRVGRYIYINDIRFYPRDSRKLGKEFSIEIPKTWSMNQKPNAQGEMFTVIMSKGDPMLSVIIYIVETPESVMNYEDIKMHIPYKDFRNRPMKEITGFFNGNKGKSNRFNSYWSHKKNNSDLVNIYYYKDLKKTVKIHFSLFHRGVRDDKVWKVIRKNVFDMARSFTRI